MSTQQTTHLISPAATPTSTRLSASCQSIVSETFTEDTAHLVIRSCLADSALYPIISGHKCNKVPLCPSSLNADMALVAAEYIWTKLRPKTEVPGLSVCNMQVPKPLIADMPQKSPGQWVELEAYATLNTAELTSVRCEFRAVKPDGTKIQDWAHCLVRYEDKALWKAEWARFDFMLKSHIKALQDKALTGGAHIMQRGLAYKVFESFVTYGPTYRGMSEVIFSGLEGISTVEFQTGQQDYCGPYHLDNSCHLSGFLCNANDAEEEDCVYVSEGWEAGKFVDLNLIRSPVIGKLTNYVRMQPKGNHTLQGDVYVLKDGDIVGVWESIKFKRLPRRVVNIFLPPPKK